MMPRAEKKKEVLLFPNKITLLNIGCGYPEMEKLIEPDSLDAVVCTLVLCTIPDPARALKNFMRWLKPGGKLLILEHIRSHNPSNGKLQDLLNPMWRKVADGCHLNRPTDLGCWPGLASSWSVKRDSRSESLSMRRSICGL
jgi:SAM-dependent methyltransferase